MGGMRFQELSLIAATLVVCWMMNWGVRLWRRSEDERRRQEAVKVLRAHGMEPHTYLPSFSVDPGELRDALAVFDYTNQLVLDRNGHLIGRVLPKVQAHGPGLRLVVDNTASHRD